MAKRPRENTNKHVPKLLKRSERVFKTSEAYMPRWTVLLGTFSCLVLGVGVFSHWILDPPLDWSAYAVALGGFGLGTSLWFGQAPELAIAVGDSGIAVDGYKDGARIPWFKMSSLQIRSGNVVIESQSSSMRFSVEANQEATAYALKEASVRVPDIVDVNPEILKGLPLTKEPQGITREIEGDQVTGLPCAASNQLISIEEDARLCQKCGQLYTKDAAPEQCVTCETSLKGHLLRA